MLTACGCQANAEQTQILRACQLHDQWARATYGLKLLGPRKPAGVMIGQVDDDAEIQRDIDAIGHVGPR